MIFHTNNFVNIIGKIKLINNIFYYKTCIVSKNDLIRLDKIRIYKLFEMFQFTFITFVIVILITTFINKNILHTKSKKKFDVSLKKLQKIFLNYF